LVEEEMVVQGNRVAVVWKARGTHQGTLMNIPATGRPVAVRGVTLLTVAEGKVSRALYLWDVAGLLRDLGLLPEL
jgi:predicted ester cyclase